MRNNYFIIFPREFYKTFVTKKYPKKHAENPSRTFSEVLRKNPVMFFSSKKTILSWEKVEKVVNAPKNPVIAKKCAVVFFSKKTWCTENANAIPIKKLPKTFTNNTPSCTWVFAKFLKRREIAYRLIAPSAPPRPIHRKFIEERKNNFFSDTEPVEVGDFFFLQTFYLCRVYKIFRYFAILENDFK